MSVFILNAKTTRQIQNGLLVTLGGTRRYEPKCALRSYLLFSSLCLHIYIRSVPLMEVEMFSLETNNSQEW
jgi:hypothetical protein